MSHDIIGHIHGHADRLEALLKELGYEHRNGAWRHPSRTAIFVGDFIDRGPGQLRTLELVRDMLDAGSARATMGNHEFNAIAWATPDPDDDGHHLRPRHGEKGEKNRRQHEAFLTEIGPDSPEHAAWVEWFLDLPLWIEEPGLRVVHACWSPKHIDTLRPHLRSGARITPEAIESACRKGSDLYDAVETVLKGAEVALPAGHTFTDKDGHVRDAIRTRWWDPSLTTFRTAYIGPKGVEMPDLPIPNLDLLPEPDRPTFIGHYWFDPNDPVAPAAKRVACVDYSVAKGGPLTAYRFDGEPELSADRFVAVWAAVGINTSVMNTGISLYRLLRSARLTHSLRHFSREWCGAAPNYACLRGGRELPEHIVLRILRRLIRERRFILAAYVARELLWPEAPERLLRLAG